MGEIQQFRWKIFQVAWVITRATMADFSTSRSKIRKTFGVGYEKSYGPVLQLLLSQVVELPRAYRHIMRERAATRGRPAPAAQCAPERVTRF